MQNIWGEPEKVITFIEYYSFYRTRPLWKLSHCREGDLTCTECSHIMSAAAGIKTITLRVIYWSYKWPSTTRCQLRSVDGRKIIGAKN